MTLLFTLLSAVAVAALAMVGVRVGTERIDDGAAREGRDQGQRRHRSSRVQGADQTADNSWIVHIEGEPGDEDDGSDWSYAVKPTTGSSRRCSPWRAGPSSGTSDTREFEQDGTRYLAFGKKIDDLEAAVTAVDLTYYEDRASSLRLRLTLAALGNRARHRDRRMVRVRARAHGRSAPPTPASATSSPTRPTRCARRSR